MKILVLGSKGQLGKCLTDQLNQTVYEAIYTTRAEINIADLNTAKKKIIQLNPDVVINAGAYTAVDYAEENKETADLVNNTAVGNIADVCKKLDCWLIHISTDYVFDGRLKRPYNEEDTPNPLNVYGQSKLNGELATQFSGCKYLILRTVWVFSQYGDNFLKSMLKLGSKQNQVTIVGDQIGCPTYANDIAKAIVLILSQLGSTDIQGVYHYSGWPAVSWAEFAKYIFREAHHKGMIDSIPDIKVINSAEYKTLAERPLNSVLDMSKIKKIGCIASDWKKGVQYVLRLDLTI